MPRKEVLGFSGISLIALYAEYQFVFPIRKGAD